MFGLAASNNVIHRLHKYLTSHRSRFIAVGLFAMLALVTACGEETLGTPTLRPQRTVVATATPISSEIARARVREIFQSQIAAIQRGDWESVFATCSPNFRAARDIERYVEDAAFRFSGDGYSPTGFEARNVEPFVRAPDRIRVRWDAYQDGSYVRTEEVGQVYIFTQGRWFDDGAWCK